DAHVLAQCQLTHVDRRAISQNVTTRNPVADPYQGLLVDAGVLVGTGVFGQIVDINTSLTVADFAIVDLYNDARRIDLVDHATASCHHAHTGVTRNVTLDTGTN